VGTVGIFSKLTIFHPYVYAYRYILAPYMVAMGYLSEFSTITFYVGTID
jgi:hypothetical protein